ncbi:cytochrome b5 domain-containing protein 1 [Leptopilina heterotoma]|uniref:cytochrome b5 domain-containing protein 1 n=1 Tax=Leptopilina heterotoma TaxID=63436 RepID=UPI001CA99842|nr:cytochrome b5 domain-containing protein 1 [Leptopilina heterotoma]
MSKELLNRKKEKCTNCTLKGCFCNYPYYLPTEVCIHNTSNDCWVSFNDGVYDLTELCQLWKGTKNIKPILALAGKDISHWFDREKNDIKHYIHPLNGKLVPYCPHGPIPDVDSISQISTWKTAKKMPWWKSEKYRIGNLTKNPRPCRIINVLTGCEAIISVCEEDTIRRIQKRFLIFNSNNESYTWTYEGKPVDLDKTLTENGILDERDRFVNCGLPEDIYIPALLCHYNDDLTMTT